MWRDHPSDNIDKLEDNLNTPDDSDIAYFLETDIKSLDKIKKKQKISHFLLKKITLMILHLI